MKNGRSPRDAVAAALPRLRGAFALAFLFEVQRLYPPMQQTIRVAMRDGELPPDPATGRGAFRYAKGASFFVSIAAINRCDRWWKDPERFDLDRFAEGVDREAPPAEQGRVVRDNARRWEEAGLYLPFGRSWVAVGIAQTIVAVVTALLVLEIGTRLRSTGIGVVAALVTTLHPYLVWHDVHLNREVMDGLLLALVAWLALLAYEDRGFAAAAARVTNGITRVCCLQKSRFVGAR